jgi:redox-sensitive bicupin YhaK (pirin superfamily)
MKFKIHLSQDRGKFQNDWLDTRYSFSFSNYYNQDRMGFGDLKVVNDDKIKKKNGFPLHHHDNMEIITLVLRGELTHKDSVGNHGVIRAGDVQVMSAGRSVNHSEFNDSSKEDVELFQIWIETSKGHIDVDPRYDQRNFDWTNESPKVLVSGKKSNGSLFIYQDAKIIAGKLKAGEEYAHSLSAKKGIFVMNISGEILVNEKNLNKRDSIEITDTNKVTIKAKKESLVLFIEVNV